MQRLLGFLLFLIWLTLPTYAQNVTVVDKTTWQPLMGVAIQPVRGGPVVQTDNKGKANVALLNSSADSLRFAFIGYQTRVVSLSWLKTQNYTVALTQQNFGIKEVVVSAGKFAQDRHLVPQQVEVLDAREITFMSQPTTADLIQQTGQVLVQKSQLGGGSPVMRGFEANRVLLVIDGIRMNNAIYRGGHLQSIITLDNSVLNRAEIVFGPGSVVYGSDALGGVLHFHTKNPQLAANASGFKLNGEAFVRYGTAASEKTAHAQVNAGSAKFGSLTAFTFTDFNDLRQGADRRVAYGNLGIRKFYATRVNNQDVMLPNTNLNLQKASGYSQYDMLQKFLYKPSDNVSHELNLQYSTSSDIPRYDRLTDHTSDGKLKFAQWYYGPQQRLLTAYTFTLSERSKLYDEARAVLAFQRLSESRHVRRFENDWLATRLEDVWVYSLQSDFDKTLNKHRLNYGLEVSYNLVQSEAYAENINTNSRESISTRYPDGGSSMQSAAAYATNTWDVSPAFILTQGIRYNWVGLDARFKDKTFFPFLQDAIQQRNHALSGSLGAVWLPGKGWRFALQGASGFRAPNIDDLGKVFDSSPGNVIIPNPDLKPEYTYNIDLTASKNILDRVQAQVTGYRTWYRNGIVVRPFKLDGADRIQYDGELSRITANVNAGKAVLYGASGSIAADITNALSFSSSINYTYGQVKDTAGDVPLDHIPPLHGRTSLNLQLKKLQAEFFLLYNSKKRLQDYSLSGEDNLRYATPNGMPAWHTFNFRASYQLTSNFQIQAALENMTDRYYRVFASGISAPGRNLVITVRGRF